MNPYYPNLFSPLRVGNVILKNRMICPPSDPHYIQGSQNYPTQQTIRHYAERAANGAALVTAEGCGLHRFPEEDHHWGWDARCGGAQNMMSQLADAVHFYGSKINGTIMTFPPPGYDVSPGVPPLKVAGDLSPRPEIESREITGAMLRELVEQYAGLAKLDRDCGFDGVYIHMSYRMVLTGRMLSPQTNRRTDEFGGSFENRIRFPLMLCRRIKELCGPDFLIEASVSGEDPEPEGWTMADTVRFAQAAKGLIDILQVRAPDIDPNHPTGFCPVKTPWLHLTETVRKSDPPMAIAAVAGFFDPADGEQALAEGKADLIAMARAFISNPTYGKLLYEGRAEELVPCIRCNKCHRSAMNDPWLSVCSVNPAWAAEERLAGLVKAPAQVKRVAVIGGGIAGLVSAQICADRGHAVTLFEKSAELGGLLRTADAADFKWPVRDFIHYHIRKVTSDSRIELRLRCEPDPAWLEAEDYDVVLAAVGSRPVIPMIPGVELDNVVTAPEAYNPEVRLGKRVVVIGGGEVGAETGLYLARCGHDVTILGRRDVLARDALRVHYYSMFLDACDRQEGLRWSLGADCTTIEPDGVRWRNKAGEEHKTPADSVVLAAGMLARQEEAMRYAACGRSFFPIGDCVRAGSIQSANRSAFGIANSL